jgi:hypothetical protein
MSVHPQKPSDCPEYVRCSAPICPLDTDWLKRSYVSGESVCLFMRETVKLGADERLADNEVYVALHQIAKDWIEAERAAVAERGERAMPMGRREHLRALLQAANSGSTLDARAAAGQRMRKAEQ